MRRFKGISKIKTNQGGLYFLEGDYTVEIEAVKWQTNRKKQEQFIIEAKVVESTNPDRAPGCRPSHILTIREDIAETIWGNIKQAAGALMGLEDPDNFVPSEWDLDMDVDEFWETSLEEMVSKDNPYKGTIIKLNCATIQTREGNDFTKHVWGPVVKEAPQAEAESA